MALYYTSLAPLPPPNLVKLALISFLIQALLSRMLRIYSPLQCWLNGTFLWVQAFEMWQVRLVWIEDEPVEIIKDTQTCLFNKANSLFVHWINIIWVIVFKFLNKTYLIDLTLILQNFLITWSINFCISDLD